MKIPSLVLFCHGKIKLHEMAFGFVIPQSQYADLTMLQQLPEVKLDIEKSFKRLDGSTFATVKIKNPSDHLAFMIHLDLREKRDGESVVPVFWDEIMSHFCRGKKGK